MKQGCFDAWKMQQGQDTKQQIAVSTGDSNEKDEEECLHCDNIRLEPSDAPSAKLAGFKVFDQENGSTHWQDNSNNECSSEDKEQTKNEFCGSFKV